jgi:hypothetical protein
MALSYSPSEWIIARAVLSALVMVCGVAIVCFWFASTGGEGRRKGKLILVGFTLLGGSVVTLGSVFIYMQTGLQMQHAMGEMVAVDVHGRQTDVLIRTPDGDEISVQALAHSPYFEVGRQVRVDYQANSRLIVHAVFLSQSGEPVGTYRANPRWSAYFMVFGGIVLVYIGIRRFRRDPKATEVLTPRAANPAGVFVDSQSLLHLSTVRNPDPNLEK